MANLYIHIPFCKRKCSYCSFNSCVGTEELFLSYLQALLVELAMVAKEANQKGRILETIFIGGGTPTSIPPKQLCKIIQFCRKNFTLSSDAEISVEANPETVNARYLDTLVEAGMNRLSIGVQTFDPGQLHRLGRLHSGEDASRTVIAAQSIGCNNINLDLMYGLPGQTVNSWKQSLEICFNLKPQHLSLYQLTVEGNTPLCQQLHNGETVLPSEETLLLMDEVALKMCGSNGFEKYEISNYCLPGYRCKHNINYWQNNDYFGAGASAVSFLNGCRRKRIGDPTGYIRAAKSQLDLIEEQEVLGHERSFRETVIMGLRMVDGLSLARLQQRYDLNPLEYYGSSLVRLIDAGLLELTPTHLRISDKGRQLSNSIMAELV